MGFICLFFKQRRIYYNLSEVAYLNLLPGIGKELVYGEIFFKDGESFSIDFSDEKDQEFREVIFGTKKLIVVSVIEIDGEEKTDEN